MIPADTQIHLQLLSVIVVQVRTQHLPRVQTAAVPPARIILLVVQVPHQHEARLVGEAATHSTRSIAVLGTAGQVEVGHVPAVHALLDGEIEHCLLLPILNTRDTSLVALLVIELHVLDNRDR